MHVKGICAKLKPMALSSAATNVKNEKKSNKNVVTMRWSRGLDYITGDKVQSVLQKWLADQLTNAITGQGKLWKDLMIRP